MTRTIVLADDLTGANDTAVQFSIDGWRTYSLLGEEIPDGSLEGRLVAIARSLRTRHLHDDEARAITRDALTQARADGVDRAYLKIDSTVRGSVAGQIAGALDAIPGAAAVVCPAYPVLGRTVEDGKVLVDGVPVNETPIGNDPVTPVTTSVLSEIIPGAFSVSALPAVCEPGAVYVVDARTDDDLAAMAREIARNPLLLPVGSAGLARHVSREWSGTEGREQDREPIRAERIVVMASSLNPVSREQVDVIAADPGAVLYEFSEAQLTSPDEIAAWAAIESEQSPIVIVRSLGQRGAATDKVAAAAEVARGLATITSALVKDGSRVAVLVLGGDGAAAFLQLIGAVALRVEGVLSEGVPLGIVTGGPHHGLPVATKAGGFGSPETIRDICVELRRN